MADNSIRYFKTEFFPEVREFFKSIDNKAVDKIFWNLDIAERTNDPRLFKKLSGDIWEFRTQYRNLQYRLLAFWDKTNTTETLVIATHASLRRQIKCRKKKLIRQTPLEKITSNKKINNMAKASKIKTISLNEMKDEFIGKRGTKEREKYEYKLNMEVLSYMIKKARQERNLTQEQLGKLVGVQKAQISKLESSANSATIDTVLRVFKALKAEINFNVTIENRQLQLS